MFHCYRGPDCPGAFPPSVRSDFIRAPPGSQQAENTPKAAWKGRVLTLDHANAPPGALTEFTCLVTAFGTEERSLLCCPGCFLRAELHFLQVGWYDEIAIRQQTDLETQAESLAVAQPNWPFQFLTLLMPIPHDEMERGFSDFWSFYDGLIQSYGDGAELSLDELQTKI